MSGAARRAASLPAPVPDLSITWHPSPNFSVRRGGQVPRLVVLHFTAMRSCADALERLCDPQAQVSAHYLLGADGTIWQLVAEQSRAWHAGAGSWQGAGDINSRSIGIELDNTGSHPFAAPQMMRLEGLLAAILTRWGIPPRGVIGHSDMAPARKDDPGPRFDWRRLARQGLSVWPETPGDGSVPLAASLDRIGYPQAAPEVRLRAFRTRFNPGATGPECHRDRAIAVAAAQIMQG